MDGFDTEATEVIGVEEVTAMDIVMDMPMGHMQDIGQDIMLVDDLGIPPEQEEPLHGVVMLIEIGRMG